MTTNTQLDMYFRDWKPHRYVGTFAANELPDPQTLTTKNCFIVNCSDTTDKRGGTHWVAIRCPRRMGDPPEYFDSYGFGPDDQTGILKTKAVFLPYMQRLVERFQAPRFEYNRVNMQQVDSGYCGHYCAYFCKYGLPTDENGINPKWRGVYSPTGNSFESDKAIAKLVDIAVDQA